MVELIETVQLAKAVQAFRFQLASKFTTLNPQLPTHCS